MPFKQYKLGDQVNRHYWELITANYGAEDTGYVFCKRCHQGTYGGIGQQDTVPSNLLLTVKQLRECLTKEYPKENWSWIE